MGEWSKNSNFINIYIEKVPKLDCYFRRGHLPAGETTAKEAKSEEATAKEASASERGDP